MEPELFEQMVESVGVGVGAYGSDGEYIYVNRAYAEMLGTDVDSLIGTPIWEINTGLDADRFDSYWDSYNPGETRTAEAVHEYNGRQAEVQTITTRAAVEGVTYNIGTIQNITLRKRREKQLSQLHEVTSELIEADTDIEIAEITAETTETILGYDRNLVRFATDAGTLVPVAISETLESEAKPRPLYPIDDETPAANAYRHGETVVIDDADTIDDGYDRGRSRSVMYVPIGKFGVLSVGDTAVGAFNETDVDLASLLASNAETALRRLESEQTLERKNERLEAFVDVISHDIPNHLNVAETRLDLAQRQGDRDQLEYVSDAHDRIESLISDMRTLVDHGKQIEEMQWLRFHDLIEACWQSCYEEDGGGTLELDGEGYIRADRSRFKQLVENLFWNAFEHAGPEPTVRVGLLSDGFYIEDDGPGIPEDERGAVLSPGYTTAAENGDHSGFGLAIVREIARAHGWEIEITEGDGGGARFEITDVERRDIDR